MIDLPYQKLSGRHTEPPRKGSSSVFISSSRDYKKKAFVISEPNGKHNRVYILIVNIGHWDGNVRKVFSKIPICLSDIFGAVKPFCFIKNYTYRGIKTFEKTIKLDAEVHLTDSSSTMEPSIVAGVVALSSSSVSVSLLLLGCSLFLSFSRYLLVTLLCFSNSFQLLLLLNFQPEFNIPSQSKV